jgi:hypothetical protein
MTELGQKAEVIDYVESYVFNSAKCFALFPPARRPAGKRGTAREAAAS